MEGNVIIVINPKVSNMASDVFLTKILSLTPPQKKSMYAD